MATCIVSGTLKDLTGTAVANAIITAYAVTPFTSGTDYITGQIASTTSASDGTWSLTLVRTAALSPVRTLTLAIEYPDGDSNKKKVVYTLTVPNQTSADFTTLITIPGA